MRFVVLIWFCIGVTVDSAINTNPRDLASRDAIDRNAPNPKVCTTYGSSAMVLDQRVFITFNPFNVYVTQGMIRSDVVLGLLLSVPRNTSFHTRSVPSPPMPKGNIPWRLIG